MRDLDHQVERFILSRVGWLRGSLSAAGCLIVLAVALDIAIAPNRVSGETTTETGGPAEHFAIGDPAELSDADAEAVYERLTGELRSGYRLSGHPVAGIYQSWSRFNTAPYRSATHGERFVNNYANGIGRAYGMFERAGELPVGTVVAKDSFTVTAAGEVMAGALFVMEKMAHGFNAESRDWRYTMIMPDGSVFGVTHGVNSEKVQFCISCHRRAGAERDHLYFVPQAYR